MNETLGVTRKRDARSRVISAMRVSVLQAPVAPRAASSARSATSPRARRAALVAPRASAEPIMIVSDLDGTMVGDDAATAAFTAAWTEEGAFPPGSALVYSTGRSLESFAALIAEKKGVMAVPDALICAVGTKVYKRVDDSNVAKDKTESLVAATLKKLLFKDAKEKEKADAAIERELRLWIEDIDWTARLDADWDADVIRAAAASAIKIAGDENAHLRPEEEFTEHKITLGVRDEHVESVMFEIERFCEAFSEGSSETPHGSEMSVGGSNAVGATTANETKRLTKKKKRVIPKLVASGTGGWQYVDVVSRRAGKLESLEYVRNAFNVPTSRTVACGDSGNDILMLGGKNKAVVVGNAQPALLRWAEETLLTETDQNRLFLASEKEALGVLEGLRKFGLMAEK
jgi:hydroxymethylpyrimidine pyrophosphatase-like HAD family hydrolase